jgi:hypothetical protein
VRTLKDVIAGLLLVSVTACGAVTGLDKLTIQEAGAGGKENAGAGAQNAAGIGAAGSGGQASGAGGAPGSGSGGASGGGAGVGGSGGTGGTAAPCKPTVPGASCDLAAQCGCPADTACYDTDVKGSTPTLSCSTPGLVPPGSICATSTACTAGYGCVGDMPGTCRKYCDSNDDCGSNGHCDAVTTTVDNKSVDITGYRACFEACSTDTSCATGCCIDGSCAAANYCACKANADCPSDCCAGGRCAAAASCKPVPDVTNLQCVEGSATYSTDIFNTLECNQCATSNCCDTWVDCQKDSACMCAFKCLSASNIDACVTACGGDGATKFDAFGTCWAGHCKDSCNIMPPCKTATQAGFAGGVCTTAPQCGCTGTDKCDVSTSGITSCGAPGSVPAGAGCTTDAACGIGYSCVGRVCAKYCSGVNSQECGTNNSCLGVQTNGQAIPGAFVCTRTCDPVTPTRTSGVYAACGSGARCNPSTNGHSDCHGPVGTGVQGSSCADTSGQADGELCATGYFCDTGSNTCSRYCHVGSTSECTVGTCGSFTTKKYAASVEIGGCF